MSRKKQPSAPPLAARSSRLARERKRQRLTLVAGLLALSLVLAIVGFGFFYTYILPRWETVATVNGTPISTAYYAKLLRLTIGLSAGDPTMLAPLALQQAIDSEVIRQRAPRLGLSVTPQEIEDFLREPTAPDPATGETSPEERFRSYLHQVGLSTQEMRRVAETSLLREKVLDHFQGQVAQEVEQVHLFAILVADEGQAQEVLERLEAGEDFAALAQELSLDPTSVENGGEMGWVPRGILSPPELEEAAFTIEPGTFSQPIATPRGFYIIKVEGREVRQVEAAHREQLAAQAWQQWLQEQRESSQIEESLTPRRLSWAASRASR